MVLPPPLPTRPLPLPPQLLPPHMGQCTVLRPAPHMGRCTVPLPMARVTSLWRMKLFGSMGTLVMVKQ
jgi:hypothetical protein